MAIAIGAKGIDLEKVQVHPTGLVDPNDPDALVKFLGEFPVHAALYFPAARRAQTDDLVRVPIPWLFATTAAEALRGVGGLLLDGEGNRFCDELGHRDYVTGRIWENGKYPVRLILNGKASKEIEWHCKVGFLSPLRPLIFPHSRAERLDWDWD